jgi:RNA polymerase sigma factor (sigma-70 family)
MSTSSLRDFLDGLRREAAADQTDAQLLERYVVLRDEAAFAALLCRHGPMVLGVCRRLLSNPDDGEDAFQATFLVLVRKAASIRPREMLAAWLYGVAYRAALKARTAAARRGARERQVPDLPEPASVADGVWHDLLPVLDRELSLLPEKYRLAVVLCDLEGRTRKEAAAQLGWPEGTVAGRLAEGRALLGRRLRRHGVPCSGGMLAVVLSPNAADALPLSLAEATVRAAGVLTTPGGVSARIVALTEGVLNAMLLKKLKTAIAVVLAVGVLLSGAVGLAIRVNAGEKANEQEQRAKSDRPEKDSQDVKKELRQMREELQRLRADQQALKKKLAGVQAELERARAKKEDPGTLVQKVFPVADLVGPAPGDRPMAPKFGWAKWGPSGATIA